jgi:hypothetical protein
MADRPSRRPARALRAAALPATLAFAAGNLVVLGASLTREDGRLRVALPAGPGSPAADALLRAWSSDRPRALVGVVWCP